MAGLAVGSVAGGVLGAALYAALASHYSVLLTNDSGHFSGTTLGGVLLTFAAIGGGTGMLIGSGATNWLPLAP